LEYFESAACFEASAPAGLHPLPAEAPPVVSSGALAAALALVALRRVAYRHRRRGLD
jgi:hypothetical protein